MNKKVINNIIIALFTSVVIAVIWNYRYNIYYFFLRLVTYKSNLDANNTILKGLHPVFAYRIGKMIRKFENEGKNVKLTSGYRSPEKQQQLYNSGQTTAPALSSYHNYGLALDMNIDSLKMASSKNSWLSVIDGVYQDYNLRWGGLFNGYYDPVHFDYGNKFKMSDIKEMYNSGDLVAGKFVKIW